MKQSDLPELSKIVFMLGALYNQPINEMLLEIWAQALTQYSIEDISMAATRWVKNTDGGQFMPKPADIIRLLEGSTGTRATEAWNHVMNALSEIGTYRTIDFKDPATHYAITEMGGWIGFGQWDNSETPFKQKRFEDLYRAYTAAPRGNPPLALVGVFEAENRNSGYEKWIEPPVPFNYRVEGVRYNAEFSHGIGPRIDDKPFLVPNHVSSNLLSSNGKVDRMVSNIDDQVVSKKEEK